MSSRSLLRAAGALPALAAGLAPLAALLADPVRAEAPREIGTLVQEMSPPVARCVIRRDRSMVEAWLRTLPGSPEEARIVRRAEPRFPPCFDRWGHRQGGWLPRYDTPGMRAGLVRALLQSRRAQLPDQPPAVAGPAHPEPAPGADPVPFLAAELGACLARKHWPGVLAIVKAVDPKTESSEFLYMDSRAEAALRRESEAVDEALSKIVPSIPSCVPAGTRLRLNRLRLRTLLEEAAYHLTASAD